MKERLSILLGVLAAAYLVWGIFAPGPPRTSAQRPSSTEAGPNGYLALRRWLEESGVPTHSLRERFDSLAMPNGPFTTQSGHVLITVMPHYDSPGRYEMNAALDWVSEGNTLVVLAALNDTPRWSVTADGQSFIDNLGYLTSLTATLRAENARAEPGTPGLAEASEAAAPRSFVLTALPGHWLTDNVHDLAAVSELPTGLWNLEPDAGVPVFVFARAPGENVDALLVTNRGTGAVIVSTFASIWQNSIIGKRDNRQLVLNLLRHHLAEGGTVIFDDFHQGLSNVYNARAFFTDPRLAWTGALLLGFWILYAVFSDSRLGQPALAHRNPGHTEFVTALGQFLARKVSPRDAGLRLVENFLAHVRPHIPAGPDNSVWDRIITAPRMNASLAEALRRDHGQLIAGRSVDLQKLQRRLCAARRAFS